MDFGNDNSVIIGSVLRVIYSRSDLERHRAFISVEPLTVKDLILNMRQMLKVVSRIV